MIKISTTQLWVHDQDEALKFYTEKVGWEVRSDVTVPEMGNFRWLTVGPAGQPDIAVVLMAIPGQPVMDSETAGQVRELMGKGFAGTIFLTTDDVTPRSAS
jgi:predicted enzyme related to lactoylglutathione lyase